MSAENENEQVETQENVPYADHIIPSETGGAQGLSGFFDMAGEITKDVVGLTKEIGNNIAELGQEIADMTGADLAGEEQLPNDDWLETEWGIMMERRAQMLERDRDMGR